MEVEELRLQTPYNRRFLVSGVPRGTLARVVLDVAGIPRLSDPHHDSPRQRVLSRTATPIEGWGWQVDIQYADSGVR